MSFTVGDIQAALPELLAGRPVNEAQSAEWIRKAVLELSEDYPFPGLQIPGPVVTLPIGQTIYSVSYFYPPATPSADITEINRIVSIFLYSNAGTAPLPLTTTTTGANPGYNLVFRTIDTIQIELNIQGIPIHWSRFNDNIYISYAPNQIYYCYANLQQEHPFPNAGLSTAPNDVILFPNSWQDIVEYASAQRAANGLRLYDIATNHHNTLYGDPNNPAMEKGLLSKRTMQGERDQTSGGATKALKMYNRPYGKK